MKKIVCSFLLISLSIFASSDQNIAKAEKEFAWRREAFGLQKYDRWMPGLKKEQILERFQRFEEKRLALYLKHPQKTLKEQKKFEYKEPFAMAKGWELHQSHSPYPCVFDYNLADQNYNANIVSIRNRLFLAMEGPSQKNLQAFFQLLCDYPISHLVRLTPAKSGQKECSIPYWEGNLDIDPFGKTIVKIDEKNIVYVATDRWKDHQGCEPEKLLALVNAVKPNEQMVAVHCRAGVGRTGTFIAACILADDIEKQLAEGADKKNIDISIDQVVWEISMQRPYAVTHFDQYLALYEFVSYYLDCRK